MSEETLEEREKERIRKLSNFELLSETLATASADYYGELAWTCELLKAELNVRLWCWLEGNKL